MKQAIHNIRYHFSQLATSLGNGVLKDDDNAQLKAWIEQVKALQLPSSSDVPNTEEEQLELIQLKISLQNVRTTRVLLMMFDMANAANKVRLLTLLNTLSRVIDETFGPLANETNSVPDLRLRKNLVTSLNQTCAAITDLQREIAQKNQSNRVINDSLKETLQTLLQQHSINATNRMITDNLRSVFSSASNSFPVVPMSPGANDAIDTLLSLKNAASNNNNHTDDNSDEEDASTQSTEIYSASHSQDDETSSANVNTSHSAASAINPITERTHATGRPWCTLDGSNVHAAIQANHNAHTNNTNNSSNTRTVSNK